MINSGHEEKAHQEIQACSAGEEACAVQRGTQEGLGGEEVTEEMIAAGLRAISLYCDPHSSVCSLGAIDLLNVYKEMRALEPNPH